MAVKVNKDSFWKAGPKYFTRNKIDWEDDIHRRVAMACLVKAVSLLQKGRTLLAQEWWETFDFSLVETIVDTADSSVFGAVFSLPKGKSPRPPEFVLAFRGTKNLQDLVFDIKFLQNCLHQTSRYKIAIEKVEEVADKNQTHRIWLAGHSLGAVVAMAAGRFMAMKGIFLESFLFNPPYPAIPIELFPCETVRSLLRTVKDLIKGEFIAFMEEDQLARDDYLKSFHTLSNWLPNVYVNTDDLLSMEYKGYFEHREKGHMQKLAGSFSLNDFLRKHMGKESNPLHLIPSATLFLTSSNKGFTLRIFKRLKAAHGIGQWLKLNLEVSEETYRLNIENNN